MWTTTARSVTTPEFTQFSGPTVPVTRDPLHLFSLYFNDTVMDIIVNETNSSALLPREWTSDGLRMLRN